MKRRFVGGKIPDEWENFKPVVSAIKIPNLTYNALLPCKCFLDTKFNDQLANLCTGVDGNPWTPSQGLEGKIWSGRTLVPGAVGNQYITQSSQDVAAVINLCYTDRYYNSKDFADIRYFWLKIPGGGLLPSRKFQNEFLSILLELSATLSDFNTVIVHCTHGVNRTGFFVVLAMIVIGCINVNDAINMFEEARGYKMSKETLLAGLRNRDIMPITILSKSKVKKYKCHDKYNLDYNLLFDKAYIYQWEQNIISLIWCCTEDNIYSVTCELGLN